MNFTEDFSTISPDGNNTFSYNFYQTQQIAFLSTLFVFVVTGNVVVLAAIILNRKKRTKMHIFIANLACADLSVGVFSILTETIWKSTVFWYADNVTCKLVKFAQVMSVYGATYALVSLSIDRLTVIAFPMNRFAKGNHHKFLIGGAWFFSALFSSPLLFTFDVASEKGNVFQCAMNLPTVTAWRVYFTLNACAIFMIPAILIAICYTMIVVTIWRRSKFKVGGTIEERTNLGHNVSEDDTKKRRGLSTNGFRQTKHDTSSANVNSRQLIMKAKIKTIKMTFVIVLVFIFCWSPYFVFDILQLCGYITNSFSTQATIIFIQSLAYLNSAANPIIFLLFNFNEFKHLCRRTKQQQCKTATNTSHF